MALNQGKSLFSGAKLDDIYLVEERVDKNPESFGDFWNINWTRGKSLEYILEKSEGKSLDYLLEKTEKGSEDIADLLPRDPFDMGIGAAVTAITGWNWIEDFEQDFAFIAEEVELEQIDHQLFGELNFVWNSSVRIHSEVGDQKMGEKCIGSAMGLGNGTYGDPFQLDEDLEDFMAFHYEKYRTSGDLDVKYSGCTKDNGDGDGGVPSDADDGNGEVPSDAGDGDGGVPSDALFFALCHLGVKDLLTVESVCKSLRDAVQNDPLLWRSIHIDQSLSDKVTDDSLVRLTNRAQGSLRCLSIVECLKITDSGLRQVVESNPRLTKLSVAGCVRLSIQGILSNLKLLKSKGTSGIRYLRIGGLSGLTSHHFEELKRLLGADSHKQLNDCKPRFYQGGKLYLSFDDDRAIDIETCPRCQHLRQVYDCPAESCQGKQQDAQICKGCTFCIARCINCGRCLDNCDYEETFCLDLLCLDCWKLFFGCQEERMTILPRTTILHPQTSYHFFLCG